MKKYNLSEIMKNAWALRRKLVITMSAALKKAWAIAKEAKKMLGTEKQIAWATEIRANIIKTFETFISDCPKMSPTKEISDANIAGAQGCIDRLNAENVHASDIIDLFKNIRFLGDVQVDLPRVMAVYHTSHPNTDGQRAILGR